ncbi:class I SAM-dependent methyltransferase [Methylotenera sp.]|uniref:class I SAM-dependent methyltransferase n=1 Tax=Methylotenera sp. TaxID=2051956 RepID=UPI00271E023E|nr:class I SAM-dependent methyltransferase [Methylotenera sp.]MDO9204717.1 class I SAM-dependent methyltransferase [Methylotenera sp.]
MNTAKNLNQTNNQTISWQEANKTKTGIWHSENAAPVPKRVQIADDTTKADDAYKLCCEGTALLWRGDFQNAKMLMQALSRRIDRPGKKPKKPASTMLEAFHLHRQSQSQKARILGMLVIELNVGYNINLRRAPDVKAACEHAYGKSTQTIVVSLREILGLVGAYEWSKNGVDIPVINNKIYPSYGVFSPIRGEYLDLVDVTPLPVPCNLAFDIGTGTGVLAAILANRGVTKIIATDNSHRALDCALKNVNLLGLKNNVSLIEADLFPKAKEGKDEYGKADLIVCNPPWLPAHPSSALESAIYDEKSKMLKGFLNGLAAHLSSHGEGWLVLSDFAEYLGLRTREELLGWITAAGLKVLERTDTKARHSKTLDASDPLHAARKAEVTSLWRLGKL